MVSDTIIFYGLMIFFVLAGAFLPIIQDTFEASVITRPNYNETIQELQDTKKVTATSVLGIVWNIIKMSTWSFGQLPLVFEIFIMLPIRALFWWLVAKNLIRGAGG